MSRYQWLAALPAKQIGTLNVVKNRVIPSRFNSCTRCNVVTYYVTPAVHEHTSLLPQPFAVTSSGLRVPPRPQFTMSVDEQQRISVRTAQPAQFNYSTVCTECLTFRTARRQHKATVTLWSYSNNHTKF
jgi:hypothetical protein